MSHRWSDRPDGGGLGVQAALGLRCSRRFLIVTFRLVEILHSGFRSKIERPELHVQPGHVSRAWHLYCRRRDLATQHEKPLNYLNEVNSLKNFNGCQIESLMLTLMLQGAHTILRVYFCYLRWRGHSPSLWSEVSGLWRLCSDNDRLTEGFQCWRRLIIRGKWDGVSGLSRQVRLECCILMLGQMTEDGRWVGLGLEVHLRQKMRSVFVFCFQTFIENLCS